MKTTPRLFVSVPDDRHLDDRRRALKVAIIKSIADQGFEPVGFEPEQFGTGLPLNMDSWTVERANRLIHKSDGLLVLALARSHALVVSSIGSGIDALPSAPLPIPTPYNHLEGALAISQGLPVLILHEESMERSGIFASGIKSTTIPATADETWVKSASFTNHFAAWTQLVQNRRDVFLGYCSKADPVAEELRKHIESNGFSVVDWSRDFKSAGATILEEIERASSRCRCAIFLFTRYDDVKARATGKASSQSIPRDNVLLEAGYFTRSHGKSRVAIVREAGAKMPADLGGIIYLSFDNRKDLGKTKNGIVKFLDDTLG
jgi:predicted nucleotide-binding protein